MIGLYCLINILTYLLFGIDKWKAIHHKSRISEKTLLAATTFFGGFGAFAAMFSFHHKIRKKIFQIYVPICMIIQLYIIYVFVL